MKKLTLILSLIALTACESNVDALVTTGDTFDNVVDTPPIKKVRLNGSSYYVYEDTMAMDSYTDAEREEVNALFN